MKNISYIFHYFLYVSICTAFFLSVCEVPLPCTLTSTQVQDCIQSWSSKGQGTLDDQLWMPSCVMSLTLLPDGTISLTNFECTRTEAKEWPCSLIAAPVTGDIHPSVCGCLWCSEDSCCQRSRDCCWMDSLKHNSAKLRYGNRKVASRAIV